MSQTPQFASDTIRFRNLSAAGLPLCGLTHLPESQHARGCRGRQLFKFSGGGLDLVFGGRVARAAQLQNGAHCRPTQSRRLARDQQSVASVTMREPIDKIEWDGAK